MNKDLIRGIGIGFLAGVIIMYIGVRTIGGAAGDPHRSTTTDAEIATSLDAEAHSDDEKTKLSTEHKTEDSDVKGISTEETTEAETTEKATEEITTKEAASEETAADDTEDKKDEVKGDGDITFEISEGMYSEEISAKLAEAGVIDDAYKFNSYLMANGLDSKMSKGSYKLSKNMSYEDAAKVLVDAD